MRENDQPFIEPDLSQGPAIREALRIGSIVAVEMIAAGMVVDADRVEYLVADVLLRQAS